jgi:hypothetical protein
VACGSRTHVSTGTQSNEQASFFDNKLTESVSDGIWDQDATMLMPGSSMAKQDGSLAVCIKELF